MIVNVLLGAIALFAVLVTWLALELVKAKDELDIEVGKHAITTRYLEKYRGQPPEGQRREI